MDPLKPPGLPVCHLPGHRRLTCAECAPSDAIWGNAVWLAVLLGAVAGIIAGLVARS